RFPLTSRWGMIRATGTIDAHIRVPLRTVWRFRGDAAHHRSSSHALSPLQPEGPAAHLADQFPAEGDRMVRDGLRWWWWRGTQGRLDRRGLRERRVEDREQVGEQVREQGRRR